MTNEDISQTMNIQPSNISPPSGFEIEFTFFCDLPFSVCAIEWYHFLQLRFKESLGFYILSSFLVRYNLDGLYNFFSEPL